MERIKQSTIPQLGRAWVERLVISIAPLRRIGGWLSIATDREWFDNAQALPHNTAQHEPTAPPPR